jgi:hypothetical protein
MNYDFIYGQIMKLSGYRMVNHVVKEKTHDSSQKNDGHNRMNLSWFHLIEIFPKGKLFNRTNNIEHILKPILKLRSESIRCRLVIHADNAKLHTTRQSQEFCK